MNRHKLPSGGWVEFREISDVRERHRRPVQAALGRVSAAARAAMATGDEAAALAGFTEDDVKIMSDVNDLIAVGLIMHASFLQDGQACTPDDLLDLTTLDYDAVQQLAAPYVSAFTSGVKFDEPGNPADRSTGNPT